jgi:hypothetical protein
MEAVLELYAEPLKAWQPVVCFDERPCVLRLHFLNPGEPPVMTTSTSAMALAICS